MTLKIFFIASLSIIILGAVIRMVSKKRIKDAFLLEVLRRIATLLVVMGAAGVWYWFVAFQQIPFLSARFWVIVWALCVIAWALSIVRYVKKTVPEQRKKKIARNDQDKYMQPKRKK